MPRLRLQYASLRNLRLQVRYTLGPPPHRLLSAATLFALATMWAALAWQAPTPVSSPFVTWVGPSEPAPELPRPWPQSIAVEAARIVEGRFRAGGTLARELARADVVGPTAQALVTAAGESIDLRRIRAGQEYRLYFDEADDLTAMRYQVDPQTVWFVAYEDDTWTANKVAIPVLIRPTFISAPIADSLHRALEPSTRSAASRQQLLLRVVDLYGWDVDFSHDLRLGDRLDLVVEERFVEGEFVGYGEILAAEFLLAGRTLPVVCFKDEDARASYFRPDGTALRRTFLRSPVGYTRISDRFNPRRTHPVTGIVRAHRGVDYAADPGTPVKATADGIIQEARYSAEPGRYVRIRHGGSYSSIYMHLSRFHANSKVGAEVRQGDVIGYVGKSGNATGYHLHYGLEQAGRYVDPIRVQFPVAEPVPAQAWELFGEQRDHWFAVLRDGQAKIDVQIAGAGGL